MFFPPFTLILGGKISVQGSLWTKSTINVRNTKNPNTTKTVSITMTVNSINHEINVTKLFLVIISCFVVCWFFEFLISYKVYFLFHNLLYLWFLNYIILINACIKYWWTHCRRLNHTVCSGSKFVGSKKLSNLTLNLWFMYL